MKKLLILFLVLSGSCFCLQAAPSAKANKQPVDWVDPFIGTTNPGLRWMLFPGPAMPFGMVKLSPDNRPDGGGYNYRIGTLLGFSHIHSWIMSGLLMMPTTGPLKTVPGPDSGSPESFRSHFRHETESASPGYYAVTLDDYKIRAELTTTTRAGFQRYTFPKADQARVMLVLDVPGETRTVVTHAVIRRVSATEIEGESDQANAKWERYQRYTVHFVARFSKPFDSMGGWVGSNVTPNVQEVRGKGDVGAFASYHTTQGEVIEVKTGISLVSIEQARLNLDSETSRFGWDFDAVRKNARDTWNDLLKSITIEGGTDTDQEKFYTNLYRSYVARTIFSDVNGKYVDPAGHIQQLKNPESPVMGCDAFWNTFWNLNQLWGLATPEILNQWVKAQLELYDKGGWLAKAPGGLRYSGMMVAEHEIALLVSAWQKGIRNFDGEKSYAAIKYMLTTPGVYYYEKESSSAQNRADKPESYRDIWGEGPDKPDDHRNLSGWVGMEKLESYRDLGYVPVEEGWTSLTLDYAYDDWCAAQLAKALGKTDDYEYFSKRALRP
jgi:predicted alpha-1,2-mannosidase